MTHQIMRGPHVSSTETALFEVAKYPKICDWKSGIDSAIGAYGPAIMTPNDHWRIN